MRRALFLLIILALVGCSARRAAIPGQYLYPEKTTPKWWIINTMLEDEAGMDLHFCALINAESAEGKNYAACYVSLYAENGDRYYYGANISSAARIGYKTGQPISIIFPDDDAGKTGWRWQLDNVSMNLETRAGKSGDAGVPLDLQLKFNQAPPLLVFALNGTVPVNSTGIRNAEARLSGLVKARSSAPVFIHVFTGRETLLAHTKAGAVCWTDLELASGKQVSLMYTINDSGPARIEHALLRNGLNERPVSIAPMIRLVQIERRGLISGKNYPLGYLLELQEEKRSFLVKPKNLQQEVLAGKRSFWMGAVECVDPKTGMETGKGNMYIFRQ